MYLTTPERKSLETRWKLEGKAIIMWVDCREGMSKVEPEPAHYIRIQRALNYLADDAHVDYILSVVSYYSIDRDH